MIISKLNIDRDYSNDYEFLIKETSTKTVYFLGIPLYKYTTSLKNVNTNIENNQRRPIGLMRNNEDK